MLCFPINFLYHLKGFLNFNIYLFFVKMVFNGQQKGSAGEHIAAGRKHNNRDNRESETPGQLVNYPSVHKSLKFTIKL